MASSSIDPPGGFVHAPICKAIFYTSLAATLAALAHGTDPSIDLRWVLARQLPWWRLLPALSCYGDVFDLAAGLHITHAVRILERHMGSGRFGAFLLLATALALSFEVAAAANWSGAPRPSPGPLPLLAAVLTLYYGYVPACGPALRLPGTGWCAAKAQVYGVASFLLLRRGQASLLPAAAGAAAAVLCATDALPLHRFRLPRPVRRLFGLLLPLLRSEDPRVVRQRRMLERQRQEMRRTAGGGGERLLPPGGRTSTGRPMRAAAAAAPAAAWARPPPPPPEEAIATLEALGFDRPSAIRALEATGNNVEAAANRLLGH